MQLSKPYLKPSLLGECIISIQNYQELWRDFPPSTRQAESLWPFSRLVRHYGDRLSVENVGLSMWYFAWLKVSLYNIPLLCSFCRLLGFWEEVHRLGVSLFIWTYILDL